MAMHHRLCAVAGAIALACGVHDATARPFGIGDLLGQESLGAQAIDPSGRWLVFEQRGPYDSAERYDTHNGTGQTLGRLKVVDLMKPDGARPLLSGDPGPGIVMGPFSPTGRRLAIFRFHDHQWTLGIVAVATGQVCWLDVTPLEQRRGRSLQWLSDREFLVIDRPDKTPPANLRQDWFLRARLDAAWTASASGEGSHTALGSGAYAALRPRAAPRRLLRVDADTGAAATLAVGEFIDMEVSPTGDRVALFRSGRDLQSGGDEPVRGVAGFETEATGLTILDLATGVARSPCPACDFNPNLLAWSPSSRSLLVFDRGAQRIWSQGAFTVIDARNGASLRLGPDLEPKVTTNPVSVRAGWMGERPVAFARLRHAGGRFDWYRLDAPRPTNLTQELPDGAMEALAIDAWGLVLISDGRCRLVGHPGQSQAADDGKATVALRTLRGPAGSRLANTLPNGSWVIQTGPSGRRLAWITSRTADDVGPTPGPSGEVVAASLSAKAAVIRRLDPHGVESLDVVVQGAAARTIATVNAALGETEAPEIVPVRHKGDRGETLTSWVYLPRLPPGSPPPPLIVRPYLGSNNPLPPRDLYLEQGFFQNLRMLTGHGYAVLVPSLPNPPGGMTDPMDRLAERIQAVMAAAETEPALAGRFDADRTAILGWSFGGYTTMAAITQTDRFRAAVALDGISDLVSYWSTINLMRNMAPEDGYSSNWSTGTVEATQPELGAPPWMDPDRYRRNSPLLAADRIHTPLLLIHGALDPIPMSGSQAMYSALFRQNKDAILVVYWGGNHSVTAPGDVKDVWARTFAFLDEHLGSPTPSGVAPSPSPAPASASSGPTLRSPPPRVYPRAARAR